MNTFLLQYEHIDICIQRSIYVSARPTEEGNEHDDTQATTALFHWGRNHKQSMAGVPIEVARQEVCQEAWV